jgi:hypothetical protein
VADLGPRHDFDIVASAICRMARNSRKAAAAVVRCAAGRLRKFVHPEYELGCDDQRAAIPEFWRRRFSVRRTEASTITDSDMQRSLRCNTLLECGDAHNGGHMEGKIVEHHNAAAEHYEHAAKHHREAARHPEADDHEKAAHHAHSAHGHWHTPPSAGEASKHHAEQHGEH